MSIDIRDFWDFSDPAKSERCFRELLVIGNLDREDELELWAQIARTYSLRQDCDTCHSILDSHWNEAISAGGRPKASFELERGRAFRTGKQLQEALEFFQSASECDVEDLRIDALHMLAIDSDPQTSHRIHIQALTLARNSQSPWAQRWQGTLLNNMGWSHFGAEQFDEALQCFLEAQAQREIQGKTDQINVAKWCVARCLRALGRLEEALNIQLALKQMGGDEFVDEELAELKKLMNEK